MKFTLSWLKEHLDTDADVAAVADAMTMAGLEVEEVHDPIAALAPFTVARIVSAVCASARWIRWTGTRRSSAAPPTRAQA